MSNTGISQNRAQIDAEPADDDAVSLKEFIAGVKDYAIFLLDASGNVISWNEGARNIKGYTKDEIIGKNFSIFYPEEIKAKGHPQHELDIARQTGRYEEEGWRVRKDGSQFWASVLITARYNKAAELVGFAKITRDLSQQRQAEQAKEEIARRLAEVNDELQHLAFTVSHELQEPIRNMTSYSKLLGARYEGRLGKDADECLQHIMRSATRTEQLVNDLWTYARITRPSLAKSPTDTAAVFRAAQSEISELIYQSKATLTVQPFESFPTLEANKEQLVFVMQELMRNSIKHRNGTSTRLAIEVGVEQVDDGWKFTFADNGPGIDKFFAKQIFDAYRRLDGRPGESGSGMGLPICKKIVEQHHGRITFESKGGAGTKFHVWLPAQQKD